MAGAFADMKRILILALLLTVLAAGCDLPAGAPAQPTPWPEDYVPTVVALTAAALPSVTSAPSSTPAPSATAEPEPTAEPPTLPPISPTYLSFLTVTVTPTPELDRAAIQIQLPGPLSKVTSPISLRGYVGPDFVGSTRIELIGEDGRLLWATVQKTYSVYFQPARLAIEIPFEIRSAAEVARLQISAVNRNGQILALSSTRLLLLSVGEDEITAPGSQQEACLFSSPGAGDEISGGEISISGEMMPYNDLPVIFELVAEDGTVLATRVLTFAPADGTYQAFATSMPYKLAARTAARLVVRQSDDRIEGTAYLFSRPIFLNP